MNNQLSPTATQSNVSRVRTKSTFIIILGIIIIILLLIHFGLYVINNNNLNNIQNQLCIQQQSGRCNDFNPCTIDYIENICGNISGIGESCQSFQCVNVPLANGSCCNMDDFCYLNDPNKACVFGSCKSPDPTLCKGYCNINSDCEIIPLNIITDNYFTTCEFNSCVTTVLNALAFIPNPMSLLNATDDFTNREIASCLQATCTANAFDQDSICIYTYTCAPFLNVTNKKKRFDEEELQFGNIIINKTIFFNLPGYIDDEYYIINNRLNYISWKLYNNLLNSTSSPN